MKWRVEFLDHVFERHISLLSTTKEAGIRTTCLVLHLSKTVTEPENKCLSYELEMLAAVNHYFE